MKLTQIRFREPKWFKDGETMLYLVDLTFDNCFCCMDFKLMMRTDNQGYTLGQPQAKSKKNLGRGNYYSLSYPFTTEFREYLLETVVNCYEQIKEKGLIQTL